MIRELPESEGPILGVEISGKVTPEEQRWWMGRLDEVLREHGSFSALILLGEGARWSFRAGLEDTGWLIDHNIEIDRIALVSDSLRWKGFVALDIPFGKLTGIREKHFEKSRLAEAWAWVRGEGGSKK